MIACRNSGHDVGYDFAEVSKIVDAGAAEALPEVWKGVIDT